MELGEEEWHQPIQIGQDESAALVIDKKKTTSSSSIHAEHISDTNIQEEGENHALKCRTD